jgi:hypothetical protein
VAFGYTVANLGETGSFLVATLPGAAIWRLGLEGAILGGLKVP